MTAHAFLDGKPVSMLPSFKAFAGSHTGERISEALGDVIDEYELQSKVRFIVTDNASNMRKAMDVMTSVQDDDDQTTLDDPSFWLDMDVDVASVMGEYHEHVSCFAHSLQLVVRDGLSVISSGRPFLSKCSKIANMVHQSALFRGQFESVIGAGKSTPSTNDTRWNSSFKQLSAFLSLDLNLLNKLLCDTNHDNLCRLKT